ncbi:hypothetical protein Tco_0166812 [Tanacetum coccineum]
MSSMQEDIQCAGSDTRSPMLDRTDYESWQQREQVTNVDDNVDDSPETDLALNVDHVFEADECDAFDSDVDEGPIM